MNRFPVSPLADSQNHSLEGAPDAAAFVRRTIVEGIVLLVVIQFLGIALRALHLDFLSESKTQSTQVLQIAKANPLLFFFAAVVIAPVMEELIFRGLPAAFVAFTSRRGTSARFALWAAFGVVSSVLFGSMHGLVQTPQGFQFQTLGLPQLLVGTWAWHVATLRGLRYSMLLHFIFNFIPVCLLLLAMKMGFNPKP